MPSSKRRRAIKGHVLLDEKTARRLRRIRWRRIVIGLGVVAVIAGSVALYMSPLLRVQKVEVVGAAGVSEIEVKTLASLDGDSMFRVNLAATQARIQHLPMVQSVKIERRWPQTVRIAVTERTPWGIWRVGEDRYVIDAQGVVLTGVEPAEGAPLIRDLSNPVRLAPGDHIDADAVRLAQALLQRVPQTLAMNVDGLEYSSQKGLALTTDAGYRVVVGDSQNVDYKLAVWQSIEGKLGREAMAGHVLDLRFEERPSFQ